MSFQITSIYPLILISLSKEEYISFSNLRKKFLSHKKLETYSSLIKITIEKSFHLVRAISYFTVVSCLTYSKREKKKDI